MKYQKALTYARKTKKSIISCISNREYTLKSIQEGKSIVYEIMYNGVRTSPSIEERLGRWKIKS